MNLGKMDYIKEVIKLLKDYVLIADVKQKEAGEVMTPLWFVKEMLSVLPEDSWSNPELKWLDPANGTGPYSILVIYKLMVGLKDWEPDEEERYKHIIENMIYVSELQPKNMFLYMNAVNPMNEYNLNIYTGSFLEREFDSYMRSVWNINKVDITIGNPPYQDEMITKKGSAKPLYNLFTEKSIKFSNITTFITPSRWFAGGKGLDTFRKMMIESNKIKLIKHFDDPVVIFGSSVEIKGGVSYFLFDCKYSGECNLNGNMIELSKFDIVVESKYYSILEKTIKIKGLDTICKGQSYSGIITNDSRISDTQLENHIKCYVSQQKGFSKWISRSFVKGSVDLTLWKVISAESSGSNKMLGIFGNSFIGRPNEICNQSYNAFEVKSEDEAKSLLSYINTKFANCMLSLRKISQHIKPDTCKWIPLIPLDREWSDEKIFEYFKFSNEEINIILNYDKKITIDF
jgi:site-specific DNA-methyltransferase (adenine-specific)